MNSFQSTLGEGEDGIAEELAESQREISIAEFFEKNKQMLGFDSGARALVTTVKEGVDNSVTWDSPMVYRQDGETSHAPIGEVIDELIETNRTDVITKRDGDLEKLRVDDFSALSFDDEYEVGFQRVSSVFRHRVNSDIYRLTVEGGRQVELTDYHSVFVLRDGEVVSVPTSDITEDDYVVLPDATWGDGSMEYVDLVSELAELPPEQTEPIGLYGVEDLIGRYYDDIRDLVDAQYRLSDFRKCDRLPFEIIRELDLDRQEYEDCEVGYRFGTNSVPAVLPVSDQLATLLGLYTAEGCVTGGEHEKVYLSLGAHEGRLIDYAETLVEDVFGIEPSTVDAHESAVNVTISSKMVGLLFEEVFEGGSSATEKRVPRFVFDFPEALRERFVVGYGAGDGYPTDGLISLLRDGGRIADLKRNRLTFATVSDRLASGIRYLLSSVGLDATCEREPAETRKIDGRTTDFGQSNVLYVRTNQSGTSLKRLPAEHVLEKVDDPKLAYDLDDRQTRVETGHALALADGGGVMFEGDGRKLAESDLSALPVTDIETIDYDCKWVYDISVPGDENFMAGTAPLACHNSLDATEEADIAPDVYVTIEESGDYYRVVVEDNGPGITKEQIPNIFGKLLYGSRFHKREQNRGQQGIGISAAVLYAQLTSGKPARITSRPKGAERASYFELVIDTDSNEPEIRHEEKQSPSQSALGNIHGTRIELEMEANLRARKQMLRYIQHTAITNPHARITFEGPKMDSPRQFERADDFEMPDETEEIRPHPHGVELGTLLKMLDTTSSRTLSGFLQSEFTRVGKKTADSVLDAFRDRHFGREPAWTPPEAHEDVDLAATVEDAVANKSAAATEAFAETVADTVLDREGLAHHELVDIVDAAADDVEDDHGEVFGTTVREKAVDAAWRTLVGDPETDEDGDPLEGEFDGGRRRADVYRVVDDVTSKRKDDATVEGLADRLARKFATDAGSRDRVTRDELRAFVDSAADRTIEYEDATFGDTAREKVVDAVWERARTVPDDVPSVSGLADDRDAASDLLEGMHAVDIIAPPTSCLAPIGEDLVEAGLRKEFDADFYAAATRDADVQGGDPFIVEAGIAYGGELEEDGTADVLRFANRVPLVYQRGACSITDVVKSIGWRNYNLDQPGGSGIPQGPAVVMVHVASTNVPFTSESKDAVANVPEIEDEIELAVREAARELKSYLNKRQSMEKRRRKRDQLATILPEMAEKLAEVTGRGELDIDDSLATILGNVLVDREVGDGTVELSVENNTDANADLEVTDIVTAEPAVDDATVVEMDGEWYVKWAPTVAPGETATLSYSVEGDADFDVAVDGIEDAKLTVTA